MMPGARRPQRLTRDRQVIPGEPHSPKAKTAKHKSPSSVGASVQRQQAVQEPPPAIAKAGAIRKREATRHRVLPRGVSSRRFGALRAACPNNAEANLLTDLRPDEFVARALAATPLLAGCEPAALAALAERAERFELQADEPFDAHTCLAVIQRGAVQVAIGGGPPVILGPGVVLNMAGALNSLPLLEEGGLDTSAFSECYRVISELDCPVPDVFENFSPPQPSDPEIRFVQGLRGSTMCFYNLCPHANSSSWFDPSTVSADITIHGAAPGAVPIGRCTPADFLQGGATVAAVSLCPPLDRHLGKADSAQRCSTWNGAAQPPQPEACLAGIDARLLANAGRIWTLWKALAESELLPGVPDEVLCEITEACDWCEVAEGEALASEGDCGDVGESVFLIHSGTAEARKLVGKTTHEAEMEVIGKLRPGAIVGDICLVGAQIPRAASVIATSQLSAVRICAERLLRILQRFPGIVLSMEGRLERLIALIRTNFVPKSPEESLSACNLFVGCGAAFLRDLFDHVECHSLLCGQAVVSAPLSPVGDGGGLEDTDEDVSLGTIYAVEYGACCLRVAGRGQVADAHTGGWLEDDGTPNAVVCAVTPVALVFTIRGKHLVGALNRHKEEMSRFLQILSAKGGNAIARSLEKVHLFQECGTEFIEKIGQSMTTHWYLPGQTVVVMGAHDAAQMFLLRSGRLAVERIKDKKLAELPTSALFGELTMLGVVEVRTVTIRALTVCSITEIPQSTFMKLLECNPREQQLFEQYHKRNKAIVNAMSSVPIFKDAPWRLLLLLYLQCRTRRLAPDARSLKNKDDMESAILILKGTALVYDDQGTIIRYLHVAECFNEEALLGTQNYEGKYVVPETDCEVLIITEASWRRVLPEFPAMSNYNVGILRGCGLKAEKRHGFEPGGTDLLRRCALFCGCPSEMLKDLRTRLKDRIVKPGEAIVNAGDTASCMYFLVDGSATTVRSSAPADDDPAFAPGIRRSPGACWGEAVMMRFSEAHTHTVLASSLCVVQELYEDDLAVALALYPEGCALFNRALVRVRTHTCEALESRLLALASFKSLPEGFAELACRDAEEVLFAPGQVIVRENDRCHWGISPAYVLLGGEVIVHSEDHAPRAGVGIGEIFGEGGALGLGAFRVTISAAPHNAVYCAQLLGVNLRQAAISAQLGFGFSRGCGSEGCGGPVAAAEGPILARGGPVAAAEGPILASLVGRRRPEVLELLQRRTKWLDEAVLPALLNSSMFVGWHRELLTSLVMVLVETVYRPGTVIVEAGQSADSFVALLRGVADVEDLSGVRLGSLRVGATFGELAVMGLLATRPSTVRAGSPGGCSALAVPAAIVARVLSGPGAAKVKEKHESLVASRKKQVARGLPLVALPLGTQVDKPCVCAVSLHAERFELPPAGLYNPLSDDGPGGAHISVLLTGQVVLEMAINARVVQTLGPGAVLPEGVVAEHGARMRAVSASVFFRLRRTDLLATVSAIPSAQEWYYTLRMLERQACDTLTSRLRNTSGVNKLAEPHPNSPDLTAWSFNKRMMMEHAQQLRSDRENHLAGNGDFSRTIAERRQLAAFGSFRPNSAPELDARHPARARGRPASKSEQRERGGSCTALRRSLPAVANSESREANIPKRSSSAPRGFSAPGVSGVPQAEVAGMSSPVRRPGSAVGQFDIAGSPKRCSSATRRRFFTPEMSGDSAADGMSQQATPQPRASGTPDSIWPRNSFVKGRVTQASSPVARVTMARALSGPAF